MNELSIVQLAAKDAVVRKFKWSVLDWSSEKWSRAITENMDYILQLPDDKYQEILNLYRRS